MTDTRKIAPRIKALTAEDKVFYSFEFYPPRSQLKTVYRKFDLLSQLQPQFCDVTWGAGGSTSTLTTAMCINAQTYCGLETNMHITCTNMEVATLKAALDKCKEVGICNIVALRGDPPKGEEWKEIEGGFAYAADLVKYIRKNYGDYFNISVAGYPEKHSDAPSYEEDLKNLKAKVDAGADVIITQLFFDADFFLKFQKDCRDIGITVPILPGLMPIVKYDSIKRICGLCKSTIPDDVLAELEKVKDDEAAVVQYGIKQCTDMCKKLIANGVRGLHFYTLNTEYSTMEILKNLGLLKTRDSFRPVPFVRSLVEKRVNEGVRPVYWQGRAKSYIARTEEWTTYPTNKKEWIANTQAIVPVSDALIESLHGPTKKTRLAKWGTPETQADIAGVFDKYWKNSIAYLPWIDLPAVEPVAQNNLAGLSEKGIYVINYLPKLSDLDSQAVGGWGVDKGTVSQKEYIEFFVPADKIEAVKTLLKSKGVSYQTVNAKGECDGNLTDVSVIASGKFENGVREPIVVDADVFKTTWKNEAFALWNDWKSLFEADSASYKLLDTFQNNSFLVSVVNEKEDDLLKLLDTLKQ